MSAMLTPQGGRNHGGRFTRGNAFGRLTRFKPSTTGNPRGRPPDAETWLRVFNQRGYGLRELQQIITDPRARSTARAAARWGIAYLSRNLMIVVADEDRAYRLYRRWYRKTFDALFDIYFNVCETPERREAARRRLGRWWRD